MGSLLVLVSNQRPAVTVGLDVTRVTRVTASSLNYITPLTGRLITAKTITGEPVSTSLEVVDATLTIGPWEGFHNFALLPISSAYSVVLGKDFCKQYALNLNFDENAMNTVIINKPTSLQENSSDRSFAHLSR